MSRERDDGQFGEEGSKPTAFNRRLQHPADRVAATLYDGVGSVKRHVDCARRGGSFFSFFPKRIFSLSCISTKARFVNRAVETGSTNHLFGYPEGEP